ncbi:MAG: GGDEF domain-containing protein [Candidatus Accumulibacter sp.]|jgi:diguanylate cyclase|nr:GGDEF domain-containing protein [Accumulibacter sp.]
MNHNNTSLFQSNRLALRRLHRRFAQSVSAYPHAIFPSPAPAAPRTLVGLSSELVRDAGMLQLLAAGMRIAELEKALKEAQQAAFADPLTGALNRRGFERAYAREMARSRRSGGSLALAMIDLDDFKALNDRYGHLAGDQVLAHLVRVLQDSIRPSDVLCRFGGEEFVLMLPDTPVDSACKAVRRFLSEFSSRRMPDLGQAVTFSAGVVSHDHPESLEEALRRADAAAYAAKRAGKNRIVAG